MISMIYIIFILQWFKSSSADPSMFVYRQESDMVILLFYVDDIQLIASSSILLSRLLNQLKAEFLMNDMGKVNYFLGISIV